MDMYEPYADQKYYLEVYKGTVLSLELGSKLIRWLAQASRHIDSLTYNRIVGQGFDNLTEFQQEVIRNVCCRQADFEYQNKDIFDMILQGYSINGVSMQFGNAWNVTTQKGIPMRRDVYEQLCQTGLCCRLLR